LRAEQLQAAIVRGEDVDDDQLIRISSTSKRILEAISAKATKRKAPASGDLQSYLAGRSAVPA
jgi:hypothetical protein